MSRVLDLHFGGPYVKKNDDEIVRNAIWDLEEARESVRFFPGHYCYINEKQSKAKCLAIKACLIETIEELQSYVDLIEDKLKEGES